MAKESDIRRYGRSSKAIIQSNALFFHLFLRNMMFTTKDRDNDLYSANNCAVRYTGAWWHNYCLCANPNGLYQGGGHAQGVVWSSFRGLNYSLKRIEMKFRPTTP